MHRRLLCSLFVAVLAVLAPLAGEAAEVNATRAFLVADASTGHILAAKDPDEKLQVASLTKIATAVIVLDWAEAGKGKLDSLVTVPAGAIEAAGVNSVGLQTGDALSVRDLLYAMLLGSDNVAAEVLASLIGGQLGAGELRPTANRAAPAPATIAFVAQMNALARSLRMDGTRFLNPTGFDAKERPFSTAADIARLTRHALEKASFRFIVAQKERKLSVTRAGQPVEIMVRNTNELLGINNVDGVKTGQTARAGGCLVLSAEREKLVKPVPGVENSFDITYRRLVVVVLGSPDRFREGAGLLGRGTGLYDAWVAAGRPAGDPKKDTL